MSAAAGTGRLGARPLRIGAKGKEAASSGFVRAAVCQEIARPWPTQSSEYQPAFIEKLLF